MKTILSFRLLAVLAILVAVTLASLATGHELRGRRLAAEIVLGLSFLKIGLVMAEFMEVRHAPNWLKCAAYGWATIACALLIIVYRYGSHIGPHVRAMLL